MTTRREVPTRSVSAALRRAGIPTGYRYTQFGYLDSKGNPVNGVPGVELTRRGRARYGGTYDLGEVRAYFITSSDPEAEQALGDHIVEALSQIGFPVRREGLFVAVEDDEQLDETEMVLLNDAITLLEQHIAAVPDDTLNRFRGVLKGAGA